MDILDIEAPMVAALNGLVQLRLHRAMEGIIAAGITRQNARPGLADKPHSIDQRSNQGHRPSSGGAPR